MQYQFEGEVWRYSGEAAWYFVTVPAELGVGLRNLRSSGQRFGSIRVRAQTGQTAWRTSLFPDRRSGSFLLPLKQDVRAREGLKAGQRAQFTVEMDV